MKGTLAIPENTTKVLIRIGIVLIYLVTTAVASFFVFYKVREAVASSEMLPDLTLNSNEGSGKATPVSEDGPDGQALLEQWEWEGTERITVLVLGVDEREQEEGPWRTDTMILLTLDPVTMQAGVLSIPRDLWVHIPGYGENRINTAHFLGDAFDHPGGGPALAMETVRYNLGVAEIDHYVRVNFNGFVKILDEIGGIDIYVDETIDDPYYPNDETNGYDPFYIEAGQQHLDGETALKYARTRHSGNGDFDRARRQQQVMLAILEKVTEPGNLPRLVSRASEIYRAVGDAVKTDFKLDEMLSLGILATKVNREEIRFGVVDEQATMQMTTPEEQQILIPLREEMREIRDYVFGVTQITEVETEGKEETATIAIFNGAGVPGLAGTTAEYIEANGISVANYDNADRQDYDTSMVILNRNKPVTALKLVQLLDLPQSAVVNGSNVTAPYDIVVILGQDYVGQ